MYLELNGHRETNLLQSLALLFFPVSTFENVRENAADGRSAVSTLCRTEHEITAKTELSDGEKRAASEESVKIGESEFELIARSFYQAGERLTGLHPKWGTITGIRPAKLVNQLLQAGLSEEEAESEMLRRFLTKPEKTRLCVDVLREEAPALSNLRGNGVSLYVSIPFCPSRCAYCSFVSHSVEKAGKLVPAYLDLLCRELALLGEVVRECSLSISTIYVGGGTPTTLDAAQLDRLMNAIRLNFPLDGLLEYTVEAGRPDTVSAEKLAVIRENGADRVSINPQTLRDETLLTIGRRHTVKEFETAFGLARAAGFRVVNTDLIAGLPGEKAEDFRRTVEGILELSPENITVHTLSLKKSSALRSTGKFREEAAEVEEMLSISSALLRESGYHPYYLYRQKNTLGNFENVGYGKEGLAGLYNIFIMGEYQTILAAGAGAVSKVVSKDKTRMDRVWNYKYPYEYIDNFPKTEENIKKTLQLLKTP